MATAAQVYRDYNINGVPSSGHYRVAKPAIRSLLKQYEDAIAALTQATGTVAAKADLADLEAVASEFEDGDVGIVFADDDEENRGVYELVSGAWVKRHDLPSDVAEAAAEAAETARDLALGYRNAAQVARDGAEAARDLAAGYASDAVSQGNVPIYGTIAGMSALEVPAGINAIRVNGRAAAGDGEGGLYISQDNGKPVAFTSGGATARAWYPATDVKGKARIGQIATRSIAPAFSSTTNKQMMSRTRHFARDRITRLKLQNANWVLTGNVEAGSGGTIFFKQTIEYPVGSFTSVTWAGGSTTLSVADGQTSDLSDWCNIEIPDGAEFFIRTYQTSSNGIVYSAVEDALNGEGAAFGPSGISDQTGGGDIVNNGVNAVYLPIAIVGETDRPSVMIVGDSRESGSGFDTPNPSSVIGNIARAVAPMCAFANVARGGESLAEFVASHDRRQALASHHSHVLIKSGINDFFAGRTAAQALADLASIVSYFPDQEVWVATIEPVTSSTDGWITLANQVVDATNASRVPFNDGVRAGIPGAAGHFDLADVFESSRNSGKWKAPAGVALTVDGTHQNLAGYDWGEQAGVVNPNVFFPTGTFRPRFASEREGREGKRSNVLMSPASLGPRPYFKATKNGVDQTAIASAVSTKVTWSTLALDVGNHFSTANGRWVPPRGVYRMLAHLYLSAGVVDAAQCQVRIAKNGTNVAETTLRPNGTGGHTLEVGTTLDANGTDYFEVWVNFSGAGDKTISGDAMRTYFEGSAV